MPFTHTVTSTDTLSGLAQQFYGNASMWPVIWDANRAQVPNPDVIRPGLMLTIPDAGEAPPATTAPAATAIASPDGYVFPVEGFTERVKLHWDVHIGGSDLFAARGTRVLAMRGGRVSHVGLESEGTFGGNNVLIDGDDNLEYYYAHGDRAPQVTLGQMVGAGTFLFGVGDSGNAKIAGPHLHIGIGHGIQNGSGNAGGTGIGFNAVKLMNDVLFGAPTPPPPPPPAPPAPPPPPVGGVQTSRFRVVGLGHLALEVKHNQSLQSPTLATLPLGTLVDAEDGMVEVFGTFWRHVVRPHDGWALAPFLAPADEPVVDPTPPPGPGDQTHTVGPGDSLSSLAQQFYGDATQWRRIFDANRNRIANPDIIRDGQVLVIPAAGAAPVTAAPAGTTGLGIVAGIFSVAHLYALVRRHNAPGMLDKIMVTAALIESGGNPNTIGDDGHSAGLWQMHDRGLGAGMSVEQRCDPNTACITMMVEFRRVFARHVSAGLTGVELAVRTYLDTERPANFDVSGNAAEMKFRAQWDNVPDM